MRSVTVKYVSPGGGYYRAKACTKAMTLKIDSLST